MEIKRTTEIFVETKRRLVVYQPETIEPVFCLDCNEQMLAAEQAAAVFQINCRSIYRFIETGAAHFAETEAGAALVCPSSLAALIEAGAKRLPAATTNICEREREI